MTNKPEDMPADLYWLAVNVSEMPKGAESVRISHDGEVCFKGVCGTGYDFYPEDIDSAVASYSPITGSANYLPSEWQSARERLGLCAPAESEGEWSGWIEWFGDETPPLSKGSPVIVRHKNGIECETSVGGDGAFRWKFKGSSGDIIAYCYRLDDSAPKSINDAIPSEWDAVNTENPAWVGVDMANEKDETVTCARVNKPTRSKYHREIALGVWVDVYDVLVAFNVTNPADAHAIKKMLMPGERGAKDGIQDRREAIASLGRAIEIEEKPKK